LWGRIAPATIPGISSNDVPRWHEVRSQATTVTGLLSRDPIDQAAQVLGKCRSNSVLKAARREALAVRLDRIFLL
jgi:hypothetical protein